MECNLVCILSRRRKEMVRVGLDLGVPLSILEIKIRSMA